MELRSVDEGRRSTLYVSREGALYRQYHDTNAWDGPLPLHVDDRGVARCSGNRCLDTVVAQAFGDDLGTSEHYRGGDATSSTKKKKTTPPPYLCRAYVHLTRKRPKTIRAFARACNVEVSTAWNYAAKVAELWPDAQVHARALVYAPLVVALATLDPPPRGRLRDVMQRLDEEGGMRGDVEWRCVEDRYAHLRLARLCLGVEDP